MAAFLWTQQTPDAPSFQATVQFTAANRSLKDPGIQRFILDQNPSSAQSPGLSVNFHQGCIPFPQRDKISGHRRQAIGKDPDTRRRRGRRKLRLALIRELPIASALRAGDLAQCPAFCGVSALGTLAPSLHHFQNPAGNRQVRA